MIECRCHCHVDVTKCGCCCGGCHFEVRVCEHCDEVIAKAKEEGRREILNSPPSPASEQREG